MVGWSVCPCLLREGRNPLDRVGGEGKKATFSTCVAISIEVYIKGGLGALLSLLGGVSFNYSPHVED